MERCSYEFVVDNDEFGVDVEEFGDEFPRQLAPLSQPREHKVLGGVRDLDDNLIDLIDLI